MRRNAWPEPWEVEERRDVRDDRPVWTMRWYVLLTCLLIGGAFWLGVALLLAALL